MTEQEKQEIINAVLSAIRTNSKTIDQLTAVDAAEDTDVVELGGGKKITVAKLLGDYALSEELLNYLSYFASLNEDKTQLHWQQSPLVLLASMGSDYDSADGIDRTYTPAEGDLRYNSNGSWIQRYDGNGLVDGVHPSTNVVYWNKMTGYFYKWAGARFVAVSNPGGGVHVINDLVTGGEGDALSAKQGKILKTNIEIVQSNVIALLNALANIAFKQLPKPEMTELDWGGEKHTVTINNTLSGCSADKSGAQQVSEGSAIVVTITADSGKLLRSVSASSGTVVIAANKTTATVTLTVNDDVTLTIQASATDADSFTASINDSRVSGTGAMSGITEGSAWTSVLSLNNTADPSDDITNVTATMVDSDSISAEEVNGVWTVHTDYVTGNITITVTVAGVVKRTITLPTNEHVIVKAGDNSTILKASDNTNPTNPQVTDGGTFECYIAEDPITDTTNEIHYDIVDVSVKLGNNVVDNAFDPLTGKVTLQDVDDNVTIEVKTLSFVGSCQIDANGAQSNMTNTHTCCATNEFIDIPTGTARIVYDSGPSLAGGQIAIYDEDGVKTKNQISSRYNWIDVDSSDKKLKMTFGALSKNDASIRKGRYILCLDSNNDIIGYAYKGINYNGYYEDTSIQGTINKILYCARLNSNTVGIDHFVSSTAKCCATQLIDVSGIPSGVTEVEFSCNGTSSTADRFGTYSGSPGKPAVTNMSSADTPKTVSVSGKTYIALSSNDIDHSFIRYTYNGEYVYLFKGLNVTLEDSYTE